MGLFAPEKVWMKVTAKNGAIVRETQGMTSEVVTELACGTLVVVDRHVIIKHKNKDIKRVKITVPNEGWMSAKSLRVSEEKHVPKFFCHWERNCIKNAMTAAGG